MHTFLTYVLLPSGWWPVKESLVESRDLTPVQARAESQRRARELYASHLTKTIILEFT